MTVKQLIDALQLLPPDCRVFLDGEGYPLIVRTIIVRNAEIETGYPFPFPDVVLLETE